MRRIGDLLGPVVHLSNNWISRIGIVLTTLAGVTWLFTLPSSFGGHVSNPYLGILTVLMLPGIFIFGLLMIPLGIWYEWKKEHREGTYPAQFQAVNLHSPELRRLAVFVALATCVNLVIAGSTSYRAVEYLDSVTFCGQTCHTVMTPEFAAYQNSPHSRVECVKCHIGPGADWFVKSKISGIRQVFAVTLNTFSRPIPTPVHDLRPARETCEACHWPQKYGEDRLRVITHFAEDETNTRTQSVLLLRIGVIHRAHQREGVRVEYMPADEKREAIPLVRYEAPGNSPALFRAPDFKGGENQQPWRLMDCMDCHNRPTHTFDIPERSVDNAMAAGAVSTALPFARKIAVELLKKSGKGEEVSRGFEEYYRSNHASIHAGKKEEVVRSAAHVRAIFERNVFPEMKVSWGIYPNHIGHTDFTGCFRCHTGTHAAKDGKTLQQDCSTCHSLLAMEEKSPKILSDLGVQ